MFPNPRTDPMPAFHQATSHWKVPHLLTPSDSVGESLVSCGLMSTPVFAKPWFMKIRGGTPQIVHFIQYLNGTPPIKQPSKGFINPGLTLIWVNYNNSPTWIKAIWGWFPLLTMIPVRSQWGRYNLPRLMVINGEFLDYLPIYPLVIWHSDIANWFTSPMFGSFHHVDHLQMGLFL